MAATAPQMGLKVWNLLTDSYDHSQLAENWAKVDQHNHTEGKGVKIPTAGIEDGAISTAKIGASQVTNAKLASPTTGVYKFLINSVSTLNGLTSGSIFYPVAYGTNLTGKSATGLLGPPTGLLYLDPADFAMGSLTTKFRQSVVILNNATAATVNFTFGLYPISSVAGGANIVNPTLGTVIAGSTTVFTAPSASTRYTSATAGAVVTTAESDFTLAEAGYYMPGVISSGSQAANSAIAASWTLKVRNV